MKIFTEPQVTIIGKQQVNWVAINTWLMSEYPDGSGSKWMKVDGITDDSTASEVITEFSGRLCYMSFPNPRPGGTASYIQNLKEPRHGSVLEHVSWNLLITNVSRSLTHELIRHRAGWAFSQLSQRYVDESTAEYVEPDIIRNDPELHKLWTIAIASTHDAYLALVDGLTEKIEKDVTKGLIRSNPSSKTELRKLARQAARSVLPNATETKIVGTANARALRHFLELRGSRHAEPEIRKLTNKLHTLLNQESPLIFGDYVKIDLPDGTWELNTKFQKI
jgi:thymidylate synthase (FAD)